MKLRVIITGATGMVGEGVLRESLINPDVEKVLVINRKPCGLSDPRLTEIIHNDFYDITSVEQQMKGYNACFFCLGVSSVGMEKSEYYKITYILTMHFAERMAAMNHDMTFCYISGAGTDSTEKGRINWARVKGKTENDLMKLPFKKVYAFRPGLLFPSKDQKKMHPFYKVLIPLYRFLRAIMPGALSTLSELGRAMINSVTIGYEKQVLEVRDILNMAAKND